MRYGSFTEPRLCGFKVQSSVSSAVRITGVNHHIHCWRSEETNKVMESRSKFENKFLNVTAVLRVSILLSMFFWIVASHFSTQREMWRVGTIKRQVMQRVFKVFRNCHGYYHQLDGPRVG